MSNDDTQPAALRFQDVTKRFAGRCALAGITLSIPAGQIVALLGENGAGKTTLMRLAAGFHAPDAGNVAIAGQPAHQNHRMLGYLPENAPVLPGHRVEEELRFFAELHQLRGAEAEAAVDRAITLCELEPVRHRLAEQLSKGYRHRLGLAQAILHQPEVLLLDEPTDGLDPIQKECTRQLLRNLGAQCAVLVSTHLLDEVGDLCHRVVVLSHGRITYDGPVPDDIHAAFKEHSRTP